MAVKVCIADDHCMVITGIQSLLKNVQSIELIGSAVDARSCLEFLNRQLPDVLLLDINLPDRNGIDLCLEIKKKYPSIRIIGLSSFNQLSFIQKMMQNGASGYLLKNAGREEIIEAIHSVYEGQHFMSNEVEGIIRENRNTNLPMVTRREKEVLLLIADGLTNHEIAEKLFISPATVDTHRTSLLTKFEVKNTANLIRLATRMGYI